MWKVVTKFTDNEKNIVRFSFTDGNGNWIFLLLLMKPSLRPEKSYRNPVSLINEYQMRPDI